MNRLTIFLIVIVSLFSSPAFGLDLNSKEENDVVNYANTTIVCLYLEKVSGASSTANEKDKENAKKILEKLEGYKSIGHCLSYENLRALMDSMDFSNTREKLLDRVNERTSVLVRNPETMADSVFNFNEYSEYVPDPTVYSNSIKVLKAWINNRKTSEGKTVNNSGKSWISSLFSIAWVQWLYFVLVIILLFVVILLVYMLHDLKCRYLNCRDQLHEKRKKYEEIRKQIEESKKLDKEKNQRFMPTGNSQPKATNQNIPVSQPQTIQDSPNQELEKKITTSLPSENLAEQKSDLTVEPKTEPKQESVKEPTYYYAEIDITSGAFKRVDRAKSRMSVYMINDLDNSFTLIDNKDMKMQLLSNASSSGIKDACEIRGCVYSPGKQISITKGKVCQKNGKWIIEKNIIIEIR